MTGTSWAKVEDIIPESEPHVRGTIPRPRGLEFWMTAPRPKGYTVDEWDRIQTEKWERIFKKENL